MFIRVRSLGAARGKWGVGSDTTIVPIHLRQAPQGRVRAYPRAQRQRSAWEVGCGEWVTQWQPTSTYAKPRRGESVFIRVRSVSAARGEWDGVTFRMEKGRTGWCAPWYGWVWRE